MTEMWKPIVGYENYYEVSNFGQVKRIAPAMGTTKNKILKSWPDKEGRPTITLCVNRKIKKFRVSKLVCLTWHGPQPTPKHQAAHWDGDCTNNEESNIRWATQLENEQDKIRHGRYNHAPKGSNSINSKLREEYIPIIYKLSSFGFSCKRIAILFDVEQTAIRSVIKGKTWKHV
jgi:hypothetical protein